MEDFPIYYSKCRHALTHCAQGLMPAVLQISWVPSWGLEKGWSPRWAQSCHSHLQARQTSHTTQQGRLGGLGPSNQLPFFSFFFILGTYLNAIFAFFWLQLCVQFDIYVWLVWASPCPEDDSLRGSMHYENNWLLGSIVNQCNSLWKTQTYWLLLGHRTYIFIRLMFQAHCKSPDSI